MNLPVILRPAADADIQAPYDELEQSQVGLGNRFVAVKHGVGRVREVLERIEAMPEMYGLVWQDVRAVRVKKFRHVVYYVVFADRIEVLAVMHGSREASAWQSGVNSDDEFLSSIAPPNGDPVPLLLLPVRSLPTMRHSHAGRRLSNRTIKDFISPTAPAHCRASRKFLRSSIMPIDVKDDLASFHAFVGAQLANGGAGLTPEQVLAMWRERLETVRALREGFEAVAAGRTKRLEEFARDFRRRHEIPDEE
jgi:plasmid stabilization system protein ParE